MREEFVVFKLLDIFDHDTQTYVNCLYREFSHESKKECIDFVSQPAKAGESYTILKILTTY